MAGSFQHMNLSGALRPTVKWRQDVTPLFLWQLQVVYKYADALRWALQLAEGLDHMHSRSPMLLHRDVKLDNVLIIGERCTVPGRVLGRGD